MFSLLSPESHGAVDSSFPISHLTLDFVPQFRIEGDDFGLHFDLVTDPKPFDFVPADQVGQKGPRPDDLLSNELAPAPVSEEETQEKDREQPQRHREGSEIVQKPDGQANDRNV
jgi:hypothetical protein